MSQNSTKSSFSYGDLIEDYDASTLAAIDHIERQAAGGKRKRTPTIDDNEHNPVHPQLTRGDGISYMDDEGTYGALKMDQWGEYMRRKRAKLQIQNAQIASSSNSNEVESTTDGSRRIFHGLRIYINGWTNPSVQDLRHLILEHGGIFHPYLDQKALVTHIITTSLTPAKVKEFAYMKVVTPAWLVDSAERGELLPWTDYVYRHYNADRQEDSQGGRAAQKSLTDVFTALTQAKPTNPRMRTSIGPHLPAHPSQYPTTKELDAAEDMGPDRNSLRPLTSGDGSSYMDADTYGAAKFGGIDDFMRRKRSKLQLQNDHISDVIDSTKEGRSEIFRGLSIYINGYTEPPEHNLRELLVQHGGTYQAYLDRKSLVTHIVTASLTPAKVHEFQRMKVVTPAWLVDSIAAGRLLPWKNYIFTVDEREEAQDAHLGKTVNQGKLGFEGSAAYSAASKQVSLRTSALSEGPRLPSRTSDLDTLKPLADPENPMLDSATASVSSRFMIPRTPEAVAGSVSRPAPESPSKALFTTDPVSPEQAARMPGYAMHKSNLAAQRAMQEPEWRKQHTSVSEGFIEGYYKNSRLHHLSMWKAELRSLLQEAQEKAEQWVDQEVGAEPSNELQPQYGEDFDDLDEDFPEPSPDASYAMDARPRRVPAPPAGVSMLGAHSILRSPLRKSKTASTVQPEDRVFMHCDFDCFFVSAGLVSRPQLKGKPVVVCHSQGTQGGASSTSEIASASYEAREFGVKGGMSLQQARQLCPDVITIPYEFEKYKQYSLQFYTILMRRADDLQAVSVDEALIEVTDLIPKRSLSADEHSDAAMALANAIRDEVRAATRCEVSIGIAHNIMLARLANRRAKPAGAYHLLPQAALNFLAPLKVDDLHGFGYAAAQKAQEKLGTTVLGELRARSRGVLCDALGKQTGETLWKAVRGIDEKRLESDKPRKSVSCDINYAIRFDNNSQAETFIREMAEEVARRLDAIEMRGQSLTLKILKRHPDAPIEAPKFMGHGWCQSFSKQTPLLRLTSDPKVIGDSAWRLLRAFAFDPRELRGIAIQIQKLEKATGALPAPDSGQGILQFPRVGPKEPDVGFAVRENNFDGQPIAGPSNAMPQELPRGVDPVDLPSFSQVDTTVLEALPDDIREELQAEYRRRSASPFVGPEHPAVPALQLASKPAKAPLFKINNGASNVKRIAAALAPRRTGRSPTKQAVFGVSVKGKEKAVSLVAHTTASASRITDDELRQLDIDPEVFALLPKDVQREQLAGARHALGMGGSTLIGTQERKRRPLRPIRMRVRPNTYRAPPPPMIMHPEPPFLKQQGADGQKAYFTQAEDVERLLEAWVERYRERGPGERDVEFFAKFLVQSVDGPRASDGGMEKAVGAMKWWLVLLRRHFGAWEKAVGEECVHEEDRVTSEMVGRAWWRVFRDVKGRVDVLVRKRYGGSLSLR